MTQGTSKKLDSDPPPSYAAATSASPSVGASTSSNVANHVYRRPEDTTVLVAVPQLDPRSQTAREAARNRAIMRFIEAFLWAMVIDLTAAAILGVQHPSLASPSPALVGDEHLINRSLLDQLDAHDAIDFMSFTAKGSPDHQSSGQDALQVSPPVPPSRETLIREDKHDPASVSFQNHSYRSMPPLGGLQPPTQQNPLRHRQSASNDALRAFGAIPSTSGEPENMPSFPQELYSSSAGIPEPSVFSRALSGPEYDFVQTSSSQVSGSNAISGGGIAPPSSSILSRSNTFGSTQPLISTFPSNSVPPLSSTSLSGLSMPAPLASQTTSYPSQQATQSISQAHSVSLSHSSVQQLLPGAPPAAQLMQMLQNLPPQQKSAVMGRLHELASGAPPQSSVQPLAMPPNGVSPQQLQAPIQEEISTIFVVGFPDDMTEREFQNMFTFCQGYEAATLKVPTKDQTALAPNAAVAAAASALAGASDPYNLVTVNSGGVVVDQGNNTTATTTSAWASGLEDPYTRQVLAAAAASTNSTTTSELAQQLALAQQGQPRKQIIGFAKFRSREDAQHARDVLHGRRIDLEKGSLLKAEMAKKNLHTKRGTGLPQALPTGLAGVNPNSGNLTMVTPFPDVLPSMNGKAATIPPLNGGTGLSQSQMEPDKLGLLPSISAGASPNDMSLATHTQMSLGVSRAPDSPTMKTHRPGDVSSFVPGMAAPLGGPMDLYNASFNRNMHSTKQGQQALAVATNLGPPASEGFHALPNKPMSELPHVPGSSVTMSQSGASSYGGSPPSATEQTDQDAGYISDSFSTSHQSESSRSQSIPRYSGYTPPQEDESHAHLPYHLLTDDVLGTPQQTDYSSKLFESLSSDLPWASIQGDFKPSRKMTDASNYGSGNEPSAGFIGSSASSVAGSVSSSGADSMSISTASIQGAPASTAPAGSIAAPPEVSRPRQGTMSSMKISGTNNIGPVGDQSRTSGEHLRGRGNAADQNPPINTLYVGNLPSNHSTPASAKLLEDSLVQLFSRSVGFSKLSFRQKNNGPMCFVEFDDVSNAAKALNDLYGNTLNGLVKNGGVRTSAPGTAGTSKITSPLQSPTAHGQIQFGNIGPNVSDLPPGIGRPTLTMPPSQPMEMPRGRLRGDTLETNVGPLSPSGRFLPGSPPIQGPGGGFGNLGKPMPPFGRPPISMGGPMSPPFMASSPPTTSPIAYQPSTSFQPFGQIDLNRESGQSLYDTAPGA
ncbi:hypothetical protein FRC17_001189 [Serendipita sp. 399]|nr:hypothetical protein FRC17_001189 [Serendipita sp. 399]